MTRPVLDAFVRFFYPDTCPACLLRSEGDGLCAACARQLPLAGEIPPPEALGGHRVLVACRYGGIVRDLVLRLKFGRDPHPAAALGAILGDALVDASFARDADGVVPVPLSRRRLRERGFDQAALIAHPVADRLGAPLLRGLLRRPVHRPPQADLGPVERSRNVRGVFAARDGAFGRALLLVDDVVTTGHTMAEAALALEAAGARRVACCAVAASGFSGSAP